VTKITATVAAVQAVLGALVLVGIVSLTDEQLAAVMAAVNLGLVAVASWFSPSIPWWGKSPEQQ